MHTFGELILGDMFNTTVGRYVKVSPTEAICVLSTMLPIGKICPIRDDMEVILLYSEVIQTQDQKDLIEFYESRMDELERKYNINRHEEE